MLLTREDCNSSMGPYKPLVSLNKVTSRPVNNRPSSTPVTTKKANKPVAFLKQEGNKSPHITSLRFLPSTSILNFMKTGEGVWP